MTDNVGCPVCGDDVPEKAWERHWLDHERADGNREN